MCLFEFIVFVLWVFSVEERIKSIESTSNTRNDVRLQLSTCTLRNELITLEPQNALEKQITLDFTPDTDLRFFFLFFFLNRYIYIFVLIFSFSLLVKIEHKTISLQIGFYRFTAAHSQLGLDRTRFFLCSLHLLSIIFVWSHQQYRQRHSGSIEMVYFYLTQNKTLFKQIFRLAYVRDFDWKFEFNLMAFDIHKCFCFSHSLSPLSLFYFSLSLLLNVIYLQLSFRHLFFFFLSGPKWRRKKSHSLFCCATGFRIYCIERMSEFQLHSQRYF